MKEEPIKPESVSLEEAAREYATKRHKWGTVQNEVYEAVLFGAKHSSREVAEKLELWAKEMGISTTHGTLFSIIQTLK